MNLERHRIVVGIDGSAGSTAALRQALVEAQLRHVDVEVVNCWQPPVMAVSSGFASPYLGPDDMSAGSQRVLDESMHAVAGTVEELAFVGLHVTPRPLEGPAGITLVTEAKGADLLVVGRRGHAGLAHLVLGSVSRYVVAHAPCPVLVVPELVTAPNEQRTP